MHCNNFAGCGTFRKRWTRRSTLLALASLVFASCKKETPPPSSASSPGNTNASVPAAKNPAPPPPPDADLTKTIDALKEKWGKLTAVSATVNVELNDAAGQKGKTQGRGNYVYRINDGKSYIRYWFQNLITIDQQDGGQIATHESIRHWVNNGAHYTYYHQPKLKRVVKKSYEPGNVLQLGGPDVLKEVLDSDQVKIVRGEKVGEIPVLVFESKAGTRKARHAFDETNGLRMQYEEIDPDGSTYLKIWLSEVTLGGEFSEDVFQHEVPSGFEFIDQTQTKP